MHLSSSLPYQQRQNHYLHGTTRDSKYKMMAEGLRRLWDLWDIGSSLSASIDTYISLFPPVSDVNFM